jgi:phospholipid transport system substrate-binding protein
LLSHTLHLFRAAVGWRAARLAALALVVLVSLGTFADPGRAQPPGPQDVVRQFYAVLLHTMQDGPALGARGRFAQLDPEIRRDFDLTAMTRLAVGVAWSRLSAPERQRVTDAFARYTAATYAQNFDSFSGEALEVTGARSGAFGTIVESRIVRPDGEPVAMDYLMRDTGGTWQIADIYLTGTISQVANLRSQFAATLNNQGVDGLIATLNSKADMLVASAR